jgi:peptide subunit release factor 1 (eRF1)
MKPIAIVHFLERLQEEYYIAELQMHGFEVWSVSKYFAEKEKNSNIEIEIILTDIENKNKFNEFNDGIICIIKSNRYLDA